MFGKSILALDRVTDYTKQPDGSWHADLYHPVRLHVEGRSPMDCRFRLTDRFDAVLTEWLERIQKQPTVLFGGGAETANAGDVPTNS